jgi:hypothetical protein
VKSRGQDVGQAGRIADLFESLRLVRELQTIEVGVRHHDVFGLAADPPAHIDITVSAALDARKISVYDFQVIWHFSGSLSEKWE